MAPPAPIVVDRICPAVADSLNLGIDPEFEAWQRHIMFVDDNICVFP